MEYEDGVGPLAIGQRLFYLEVPDSPTTPAATGASAGSPRRSSDASAVIDRAGGEVKVSIYLSEADAQSIAARLRKREPLGASLAALRRVYGPAIGKARSGRPAPAVVVKADPASAVAGSSEGSGSGAGSEAQAVANGGDDSEYETEFEYVYEFDGSVSQEDLVRRGAGRPFARRAFGRPALRRRSAHRRRSGPRPIQGRQGRYRRRPQFFRRRLLVAWITRALAGELDRIRDAFLGAADAPEDGVTITLTIRPAALRAVLAHGPLARAAAASGPGQTQVDVKAGHPSG